MMYESKLVACLKSNGKVLREHKDIVYVPFGTEYSITLKNLNSVRAMVNVSIDGKDIADGKVDFIVNANTEIDLTRFLSGGNKDRGNRFKFIERTAGIEQHRGVGVEDGIIRVEFQFERQSAPLSYPLTDYWHDKVYYRDPGHRYDQTFGSVSAQASVLRNSSATRPTNDSYAATGASTVISSYATNDAGITVPGSVSDQKFTPVSDFALDGVKHVMVLRLVGETPEGKKIIEPVTVKRLLECVTCGKKNKSYHMFCSVCGTSLELV